MKKKVTKTRSWKATRVLHSIGKTGSLCEKGRKITRIYILSQTNHERKLLSLTFIRGVKKHYSTNFVAVSLPGDLFSSSPVQGSRCLLRTIYY